MEFLYTIIYNRKYRNVFFKLGELLLGAVLGLLLAIPMETDVKIMICLGIALFIFVVCIVLFSLEEKDPKRFDIIRYLRSSDYEVAISWAYTMRNLLSHAGYIKLKVEIAKTVYEYFEKYNIDDDRVIYDTKTTAGIIKSTILIDDFGWYNYELSFENATNSIQRIREGIELANKSGDVSLVVPLKSYISYSKPSIDSF